jgi:hypothetical protein
MRQRAGSLLRYLPALTVGLWLAVAQSVFG